MLRRPLTALLLAAALLSGCGGGGDTGPQTKEGFISAADRVCEELFSEVAQADGDEPKTPQDVADANEQLARTYDKFAVKLADVRLPDTGAARTQARAFVASVRAAEPLLTNLRVASKRFVAAAGVNDQAALTKAGNDVRTALDAFRASRADSDRLAVAYGLNFCGNLG